MDRRATRNATRLQTNFGTEDQANTSEDTELSRNSSTETVIEVSEAREDVDSIIIKLDRLQDKSKRYESHKHFLEKCISEKVIPDGLRINVEPTIGNHDDDFLSIWYNKLEGFSVELMQEIVKFCDKILAQTKKNIKATDTTLKRIAPREEYHNIQVLIAKNVEKNKRSLNQRKTGKFNKIKYQLRRNTSNEKRKTPTDKKSTGNFNHQERYLNQEKQQMLAAENQAQRDREVAKEINKTPQRKGLSTLKFSPDLKAKINKPDQEDKSASNANEERTGLFNFAKLMAN